MTLRFSKRRGRLIAHPAPPRRLPPATSGGRSALPRLLGSAYAAGPGFPHALRLRIPVQACPGCGGTAGPTRGARLHQQSARLKDTACESGCATRNPLALPTGPCAGTCRRQASAIPQPRSPLDTPLADCRAKATTRTRCVAAFPLRSGGLRCTLRPIRLERLSGLV